jgi:predicted RNA-binding Zn-ribbon protein involved in translation (DUF1610 family)
MQLSDVDVISVVIRCASCGVAFGFSEHLRVRREETGQDFHCPNGHVQVYRDSELVRARRELKAEQERRQRAETQRMEAERQRAIAERKATRARNDLKRTVTRVEAGVCPHCNRTFQQLARHMQNKHKDAHTHADGSPPHDL